MKNNIFRTSRKFRIPRTVKRVFNFVSGLFLTACCFFGAYVTFQNGWTDLNKVDKFEGVITEKGITTYQTSTSGGYQTTLTNQAFYLKLKNHNQTLGVYNPRQTYVSLDNSLFVGDTIKVFYKRSNLVDKLNIETFQIEKNNQEILIVKTFRAENELDFILHL